MSARRLILAGQPQRVESSRSWPEWSTCGDNLTQDYFPHARIPPTEIVSLVRCTQVSNGRKFRLQLGRWGENAATEPDAALTQKAHQAMSRE